MLFRPISTRLLSLWNRNTNNVHLLRVEAGVSISDME